MKYNELIEIWLENYVRPMSKQRTYLRYKELARLHIIPYLGSYEISEISIEILQNLVTYLLNYGNLRTRGGLSSNTVCSIINVLQGSLKTAVYLGCGENYIADKIKRPVKTEKEIHCFTIEEQRKIIDAIKKSGKTKLCGITLCFYTGLRIGELLALTWSDINMETGIMEIKKSCHDGKDEQGNYIKIIESPKSKSSKREIPLPKQILPLLKDLNRKRDSNFIVSTAGCGVSVRSYQRSFYLLLKKLNIERRGFHTIRHTFATRALECGMDVKTLAELLGHKSPTTTLNRYAHSFIEHKRDMMNRLGKLL